MCSVFQSAVETLYYITTDETIGIELLLAPIFMMTMCARGFILWIINVGLVIYLGLAANKLNKKVRQNNYTIFR
jgi:hypothetical protein